MMRIVHIANFTRDRRFAFFQSPFQVSQWAKANALFVDVDYTRNHHFPYLFNVDTYASTTLQNATWHVAEHW